MFLTPALKQKLRPWYLRARGLQMPPVAVIYRPLSWLLTSLKTVCSEMGRIMLWTPIFRSQIQGGDGVYLYSGVPQILGPVQVSLGKGCRVSGISTLCGRPGSTLNVGDNVDIGWQNTIACGTHVVLGDNVRLAPRVLLAGYPGHPLDPQARAAGEPERPEQARAIILERDVWLGTGSMVMAGVTIGAGTVVAAGSVVTRDLPPGVLAGGNPARVIRRLEERS
ncbi:acyltransferase [Ferrimonas sp. YFM]|uniref:acyltransferase n=1 Tax=Ferrimonas sp. YFM TaxID=3028878 RepID=UPI0025747C5F|nr:acyltransferase [Ferrimonas sp. YFM]BDY04923.1 acetyltransferase [Ferrimonas sp. YFM]